MATRKRGLYTATEGGDRYECLETLALTLADAIDSCESKRDLAALSKRYIEVSGALEAERQNHVQDVVGDIIRRSGGSQVRPTRGRPTSALGGRS